MKNKKIQLVKYILYVNFSECGVYLVFLSKHHINYITKM